MSGAVQAEQRPLLVSLIVSSALFMQLLDGTIIATALPQMAISFGASAIEVSIGITAYILAVAVFIPVSGWVADRFGTRSIFRIAIGIFTVGSVLCGLSGGLLQFTLARILQGLGGAMMVPVGQLIVLRAAPKRDLVRAMNFLSTPGLMAPVIGPPVGGFITTYASWHWIFFLNLPIGLVGIALATLYIADHRAEERRPLDWAGFLLAGAALVSLIYGLQLIGQGGTPWPVTTGMLAAGAVLAFVGVKHALRHRYPLIDLSLFKVRVFAASLAGGSIFRTTIGAAPYLLPLMLQIAFGMTAFAAGMMILLQAAADLAMKAFTRRTLKRLGFRAILIGNGLIVALSTVLFALIAPETPGVVLGAALVLNGASRSLQFTGLNTLAFADIPPPRMSAATTLNAMAQQVSFGTGTAFGAVLLQAALALRGAPPEALGTADFHLAFVAVALVALVSVIPFFTLGRYAGAEVSGHRPS